MEAKNYRIVLQFKTSRELSPKERDRLLEAVETVLDYGPNLEDAIGVGDISADLLSGTLVEIP